MALKHYVLMAVVVAGMSGAAVGQGQLIVPGPPSGQAATSGPAAGHGDYSEPRKALASFMKAEDEAAMREALIVDPGSKGAEDAFLGVMVATIQVQKEAQAQYGTAAAPYFSKATDAQIQAKLRLVASAPVDVQGDRATVHLPEDRAARQAATDVKLRKVGSDWRIEAASLFNIEGTPAEVTAQRVKQAEAIRKVSDEMVKEIAARKYPSAGDAYRAYMTRSNEAIKPFVPTTRAQ